MTKSKNINKEFLRHETEIWQLSVHPRQRRIPELGETQSILCVLGIDNEAVPFLTIYDYLLIIKGSRWRSTVAALGITLVLPPGSLISCIIVTETKNE
jgi:hypothetical protein